MSQRTLAEDFMLGVVTGGLRQCINHHGPVTMAFVSSAARRIAGHIVAELKKKTPEELARMGEDIVVAEMMAELKHLRKRVVSLAKNRNDLLAKLRAHGIDPGGSTPNEEEGQ